ncbi:MAG: hypothetical protein HY657_00430 [Acidobacteria bacterium]|nr:hypothetical protein [Acidobacteriota bacterium]
MMVIVRDRIQDALKKRMTLEQVKAARLTRDYDVEYVGPNSFVSADRFVEAMYKDLAAKTAPAAPARGPGAAGRGQAPAGRK